MIRDHYDQEALEAQAEMERELEAARERGAAEVLEPEDFMSDGEADADALASAGWGTDEDYGYYG